MDILVNAPSKDIMIVEDSDEIRMLLAELLSGEGYQVECAGDGEEALRSLRSKEKLPSLLLLDLMMPKMDGLAFREAQQKDPRLASIPIVLMTAGGDIPAKANAMNTKTFLKKPFEDIETILKTVESFFPRV